MDTTTDGTSSLEILLSLDHVGLLQDETNEGSGKLVLTTSAVTWTGSSGEKVWGFRDILMHAVSREGDNPALYAQLKGKNEFDLVEVRFVPQDSSKLDEIFAAFSRGACLNPDEVQDDEDAGNFYFDADEVNSGINGDDFDDDEADDDDQNGA